MAINTPREEPLSPGAGRLRLTPGSKKAARLAAGLVFLIVLILTFDKTVFLFRLAGAALRSGAGGPGYFAAMARCAYQRPGLLRLLEIEAGDPEFLAAWIAEHLRREDDDLRKTDYGPFPGRLAAKFPDNIVLDSLGISPGGGTGRDWQDFDALFFRLAGDPRFNALAYAALTNAFQDGRLPPDALPRLLGYLTWKENPGLADRLREWGTGDPALNKLLSGAAVRVRASGPAASSGPGPLVDADEALAALAGRLGVEPGQLRLVENLIPAPALSDRTSFARSWEFLDMSGREPFARGSFAGGVDPQAGPALRVMGFFTGETPGRIPCRAGFGRRQAIPLHPETYLFTFRYKTLEGAERPSFWLANVEYTSERELGPTGGAWRRVLFVFRNAELGIPEVKPLLRMWGRGTVWFTDVGLYAIETDGAFLPADKEALLYE